MSDFLLVRPRFWMGVARTLDRAGQCDEVDFSATETLEDVNALRSDWLAVGKDFLAAASSFAKTDAFTKGTEPLQKNSTGSVDLDRPGPPLPLCP